MDKWNLIPGEPWQQEIERALRACATCAVCIGPSGIGPWQNEEMRTAIDRRVSQGNFQEIFTLCQDDRLRQALIDNLLYAASTTLGQIANPPTAESFVEVSHEALIRGWSKLREWLDADRDALRIQHRLAQAAREWNNEGRANPEAYVYRGVRLAEAEAWAQTPGIVPSALEQEFMETSITYRNKQKREEEERRWKEELSRGRELEMAWELAQTERRAAQRLRRRNWLLGMVAVIALLFATLTMKWWFEAEEALQAARQQSIPQVTGI